MLLDVEGFLPVSISKKKRRARKVGAAVESSPPLSARLVAWQFPTRAAGFFQMSERSRRAMPNRDLHRSPFP